MGQGQGLFSIHDESVGDVELLVAFEQSHDIPCPPGHSEAGGTNWGLGRGSDHTGGSQGPRWRGREGSGNIRREPLGAWHLFMLPLEASFVPSRQWARNRGRWHWGSSNQALAGQRRMNTDIYSEPCTQSPEPKSWPGPQSPPGPTLPDSAGDQG